jgi:hypothetical protein
MVNNRHLILKVFGLILLIFCIHGDFYKGYCIKKDPVVVVREMDLSFGPVPLPLNGKTKNDLKKYIRSGGDKRNIGPVAFYSHKKKLYEELLSFLSSKEKYDVRDIFAVEKGLYKVNPRVSKWFEGPVVYTIIDATQKRPLSEKSFSPLALSDGQLWWIFYRNKKNQIVRIKLTMR